MSIRETEEFLKMSDGFRLFARRWRPIGESVKTVVLIHGFGGHSGYLSPIGRSLAAGGVEVYGLDLRGFGNSKESDLPRGDTRDFRRHLMDLNETVNIIRNSSQSKKVFMLGHSLGGLYVLWYGAKYPDSSDGLIILAPSIEVKQKLKQPSDPEKFKFLLDNAPETLMETIKGPALEDEESMKPKDKQLVQLRARSFSIRYIAGIRSVLMREKVFLNAAEVKKPTLILQGDADEEALPTGAKRLLESLSASDKALAMVPGAQHSLYGAISNLGEDDAAKKERVFLTIKDWLKAH